MKSYTFTAKDLSQIQKHGLSEKSVYDQLQTFQKGIPYIKLATPATSGNGIIRLNERQLNRFSEKYTQADKEVVKFVPASGAATRMFKPFHQFLQNFDPQAHKLQDFLNNPEHQFLKAVFDQLNKLPFYQSAKAQLLAKYPNHRDSSQEEQYVDFIRFLLFEIGYNDLPKGLIPFHHYAGETRTAFAEHLAEAATYAAKKGKARLHFTISRSHLQAFKAHYARLRPLLEKDGLAYEVSFSYQKKATDTIAVDLTNTPVRDQNNRLVFRPGGHGALLQNLNKIEADIIFIKNIDNVVLEKNLELLSLYKKALAGLLLTIQENVFLLLRELDQHGCSDQIKETAEDLAFEYFHYHREFMDEDEIRSYYNRPIRVCGMVKNEGEPGGGPFWIRSDHERYSLQIVESSQIYLKDEKQAKILQNATYFNPVDLVCGVKDYQGNKFDLQEFVNPNQGFISQKSIKGKPVKALELPGLWNGSMAYWNTIFVEVPLKTFNPVKSVSDLLRKSHQVSCF